MRGLPSQHIFATIRAGYLQFNLGLIHRSWYKEQFIKEHTAEFELPYLNALGRKDTVFEPS